MAIEIDKTEVERAEAFLETFLTESIANGRFTKGSALRDLVVKPLAFIYAHLQKENAQIQSLQSLLRVEQLTTITDPDMDQAVSSAVDAILSNWFVYRNPGNFARGTLVVTVSKRQDYIIPPNNRFTYGLSSVFFPDVTNTSANIIVPSTDLLPVVSSGGVVEGYQFRLRLVAARTGASYNVQPSTWVGGGNFSPFVTSMYNEVRFDGGQGRETTTDLIARANSAIAVRNLINPKSIDITLQEEFTGIRGMLVVGMGDPEMMRDLKVDTASGIQVHLGGHYDVYLDLPRTEVTFRGAIGGAFVRPDGVVNVFRDTTAVGNWLATGVQVGDILRIASGLPDSPRDYTIRDIHATELWISTLVPFSAATDEDGTFVDYYIYRPVFGPDLQILPVLGTNATGQTSRTIRIADSIVLPGGAHYDILDVAIIDPPPGMPFIDTVDGYVHFPNRVNDTPVVVPTSGDMQYQIQNHDWTTAQSQTQFETLSLTPGGYTGLTVRVIYETLAGLDAIHDYMAGRFDRIVSANGLARGFNPVYLSCTIPFKVRPTATATFDYTIARQVVVDFINNFDPHDTLDVSDISRALRNSTSVIGSVLPFEIVYYLTVPDGRIIEFTTSDEVLIDPDKITDTKSNSSLASPLALGITDKTVRYMTTLDRIQLSDQT